jgi:hypothetical protein
MDPEKLNVEYEIVDTENPQNNETINLNKPEMSREEAELRIANLARAAFIEKILRARENENKRALKGRVTKRRTKDKAAKASRKRNRK